MRYNSRIDVYNWITMALTIIVMALPNFIFDFSWLYFSFMIILDLLFVCHALTTSYKLSEEELVVRSGLFKFGIYYDRILKITKVQNLFDGAYSTSHKSIRIEFGDKEAVKPFVVDISPSREDEFLNELKKRCENVVDIENKRK